MLNATLRSQESGRSLFVPAADDVRLHVRLWEPPGSSARLPIVCLAGLTRSGADFVPLASALAGRAASRRVVALDCRGRGRSDPDPQGRYDLSAERADLLVVLDSLGIGRAHFVGTSRGGLNVMTLAAENRERIAAVVLNDIGPILERDGLLRIKSYVGRQTTPSSLTEAVRLMKVGNAAIGFDGLDEAGWRHFAETTFGTDESDLRLRYDLRLKQTLDDFDPGLPGNDDRSIARPTRRHRLRRAC